MPASGYFSCSMSMLAAMPRSDEGVGPAAVVIPVIAFDEDHSRDRGRDELAVVRS